MSARPVLFAR